MAENPVGGYYYFGKPETELSLPAELEARNVALTTQEGLPMVDLRTEFSNFMGNYGQMVLVQRMNLHIHCPECWNEKLGEADPQCPYCLGRGYLSVIERHIARKQSSLNEHRLQLLDQAATGPEVLDEVFWYFEYSVNPQVEDIVYEVTWADPAQTRVQHILEADRVNYAFPFRGLGGRIEYWRVSTKSRPIDRDVISNHLRRISSRTLQIPNDGIIRFAGSVE